MSTTSGWIANMRFPLSHQNHFASIPRAKDSLTPPTQRRSSTPPSRNAPKSASSQATSVACCLKTCPTASPTSPATSNLPTQARRPKPQWLRKVSCLCSLCTTAAHILLFYTRKRKHLSDCQTKRSPFWTCIIFLIAELLLPCSAWSVLLQSCSGLLLTLMTLPMLLEIHWLWTRHQTAAYVNAAPIIIRWLLRDSPEVVCMHKVQWVELNVRTVYIWYVTGLLTLHHALSTKHTYYCIHFILYSTLLHINSCCNVQ